MILKKLRVTNGAKCVIHKDGNYFGWFMPQTKFLDDFYFWFFAFWLLFGQNVEKLEFFDKKGKKNKNEK